MPSTINIQTLSQNAQFQQFVQFAETAIAAGKQKAIARVSDSELGGIVNRTIVPGTGDWVGIGVGRLSSLKKANNTTREAFMKAVSDMFGGREWKYDRGPEQRNAVKICILNVLFAKTPGLKEAIFSRKAEMKDSFQEMLTTYKTNARGSRESVKGPDYDLANVLFGDKCFDYLDMERQ